MYKTKDKVIFKVGEESFEYIVTQTFNNCWYLSILAYSNSIIFEKLNIVDRFKFVKDISKYATDDKTVSFPEIQYPDETEINKVIDALLEKCDEYNKRNGTTKCYNHGDKIVFKLPDKNYNYHVIKNDIPTTNRWFLSNDYSVGYNEQIFDVLNITDRRLFCRDVSGCEIASGQFPEICCPDSTGISKVINKLMEMCEEKMKESLKTEEKASTETTLQEPSFEVGDYVRVISKEDVKEGGCYRFGFAPKMFDYCGNIYVIDSVSNAYTEPTSEPDDGMLYQLKTITGDLLPYNFASSMLTSAIKIIPPQLSFLKQIQLYDSLVTSDYVQETINSETKTVLKKSKPEYKLKFTN